VIDLLSAVAPALADGGAVLATGLVLGIRHGFDWDHIAAITDITSTTATAGAGEEAHAASHDAHPHDHAHGGRTEVGVHGGRAPEAAPARAAGPLSRERLIREEGRAVILGTLYALGHAVVVLALGLVALQFGALLPDWVDPLMGRVVGLTLLFLGAWVFVSLYNYLRHGGEFRLRSRWMLVLDTARAAYRRIQARLHGHEHVEPVEMSSYGRGTAFGVGMIHGIGAETGSQALLIATVGGAAGAGLGVPMLVAFVIGLVVANTVVVVLTATGFVAGRLRTPLYLAIGLLAGVFSIVVGFLFLIGNEGALPEFGELLGTTH
jgi:high-affinity nickel-transport protein